MADKDFPLFSSQTRSKNKELEGKNKSKVASVSTPARQQHGDAHAAVNTSGAAGGKEGDRKMELILSEIRALGSRLDGIDDRLNGIATSIPALEGSVANLTGRAVETERRLDEAEGRISKTEDTSQSHDDDITEMRKAIAGLQSRVDFMENMGRKKNVKIVGLNERAEGDNLIQFLQRQLPVWLGLPENPPLCIERAHRSPIAIPQPEEKPRSILVRFLRYHDKDAVMKAAIKLRFPATYGGATLRFYSDLSAEVLNKRRKFEDVGKEMQRMKIYRGFAYPAKIRCLHEGKIQLFDTPGAASIFLDTLKEPPDQSQAQSGALSPPRDDQERED